jgi:hypothetical protein
MPTPTNLTDRISHLRDRKSSSPIVTGPSAGPRTLGAALSSYERKPANDFFMLVVYKLLGIAVISQFVLIALLEVI